jgi:hypothetical protein
MKSELLGMIKPVHVAPASVIAANEDVFAGDPATLPVNVSAWKGVFFQIIKNAGAVGTATITIESCSDTAGTGATAIPFRYCKSVDATDSFTTWTDVAAAGVATAAGADQIYWFAVSPIDLVDGHKFVRLQVTEIDSTACDGAINAFMVDPRYSCDQFGATVLS